MWVHLSGKLTAAWLVPKELAEAEGWRPKKKAWMQRRGMILLRFIRAQALLNQQNERSHRENMGKQWKPHKNTVLGGTPWDWWTQLWFFDVFWNMFEAMQLMVLQNLMLALPGVWTVDTSWGNGRSFQTETRAEGDASREGLAGLACGNKKCADDLCVRLRSLLGAEQYLHWNNLFWSQAHFTCKQLLYMHCNRLSMHSFCPGSSNSHFVDKFIAQQLLQLTLYIGPQVGDAVAQESQWWCLQIEVPQIMQYQSFIVNYPLLRFPIWRDPQCDHFATKHKCVMTCAWCKAGVHGAERVRHHWWITYDDLISLRHPKTKQLC